MLTFSAVITLLTDIDARIVRERRSTKSMGKLNATDWLKSILHLGILAKHLIRENDQQLSVFGKRR